MIKIAFKAHLRSAINSSAGMQHTEHIDSSSLIAKIFNIYDNNSRNTSDLYLFISHCHELSNDLYVDEFRQFKEHTVSADDLVMHLCSAATKLERTYDLQDAEITPAIASYVLLQSAPQGLTPGCVLQNYSTPSNSYGPTQALGHSIHRWFVDPGARDANHALLFRRLLEDFGIDLPPIDSPRIFKNEEFLQSSWDLLAYRLSLSFFPRTRAPEIVGASLFELFVGIPWPLRAMQSIFDTLHVGEKYFDAWSNNKTKPVLNKAGVIVRLMLEEQSGNT